ncbi:hypothetical protein [Microbacterium pygmaeum]|uniref:Alkaline shock response membrane anchor protein AmaP n=1 Tax=Microbacterium pygmaeum TaxID=370764 RepID=A0A1G7WM89_9MICO|nr:hypothetical protein [Microbacterium pygmaeum]SDG72978.1 hypothetical protein SAMN04489810_1129 [Microbacterium pygmaeum]
MNDTNRALNRIVLIIVGIALLALGAAVVTVMALPVAADYWTGATEAGRTWIDDAIATTMMGATALSGLAIGVLALIVLLVILLIVVLTRIGGGRTRTVLRGSGSDNPLGRVHVRAGFVSDALQHSLRERSDILFSSVSANDVRKQPVMHVSVTPRQNTSPKQVLEDVDRLVSNLATLTGEEVPTYISIHSGLRSRLARDQRRLA